MMKKLIHGDGLKPCPECGVTLCHSTANYCGECGAPLVEGWRRGDTATAAIAIWLARNKARDDGQNLS